MIGAVQWDRTLVPLGVALVVGLIASVPQVARGVGKGLAWLAKPSGRARAGIAVALFVLSARYFLFTAEHAGRPLIPVFHDEYMYLLQARMLSVGHLWMRQHPMAEFFDSILVQVKPVYAAPYFPGTAMLYVPGTWLGLAPWATSVTISGLVVALTYLLFSELLDGVTGLLAALLMVANAQMRGIAVMTMSHTVLLLMMLAAVLAWSRWRKTRNIGWAVAFGAASGWALITRPLDALCLLAPVAVAVGWEARRGLQRQVLVRSLAAATIAAVPFVALQLVFDRGVTGRWFTSPIGAYGRANFPGFELGFHRPPATGSPAELPQVRDYYDHLLRGKIEEHADRGFWRTWAVHRMGPIARSAVPNVGLLALAAFGIWALRRADARLRALAAFVVLLSVGYALLPIYLEHYGLVAAPAVLALALLGVAMLPGERARAATVIGMAALAVASLPEVGKFKDGFPTAPYLVDVEVKLSELEHTPALVMFKYESGRTDVDEEPVYNLGAANVDDEVIVRAQDRGADNVRLYKYYAGLGQKRFVYVYDRAKAELRGLGWVEELARD